MVKKLDYLTYPPREDHIGARLWRLSELWKRQFDDRMAELGHSYFAEARGSLMRYIGPKGVSQSLIVKRTKLSKQAIQQLLDGLQAEGVIERQADPGDKRGNLIVLTQKGLRALHDANRVKRLINRDYEKQLGAANFVSLNTMLEKLAEAVSADSRPT